MVQKDSEISFQNASPDKEELKTITYKKPKSVDSIIIMHLVEEVSESLDELRIGKNVSFETRTCYIKLQQKNSSQIIKKLEVDINDRVELKKAVKNILRKFDAANQELCISIDDFSSSFDQEEALVSPIDNLSEKSTIYGDDASSLEKLRTPSKILHNDEDTKKHYVGLVNQAMTCYLNSLLQTLFMTPEFRNALYNWEYKYSEREEDTQSIPFELQKLFLNLQISQKSSVETNFLTESLGWDSFEAWEQRDIQEFCRVLFDALEQKFKNTEQADLISKLYEGKISDYIKCLKCNRVKAREDTFLNIPLPVRLYDTNEACSSVEEALEAFVKYETLEGDNQYFCQKCCKKTNALKELKFKKFPYILMLQLKRFDFDQKTNRRKKLNDKVTFPKILNLDSFIESASSPESPSLEEDAGLCDDNCTIDNSSGGEGCILNNSVASNRNHLTNHDQLGDEGIVSNESSCSSFNQNEEKLHGKYNYELFSIMIHSGNVRSGHYYTYIKDFETDKWLCFNDQSVTSISSEEIKKAYGGNKLIYRNNTNAYMLMYRRIVPDNCLPMKAEDFPAHIKDLVEKIKNEDNPHQKSLRKPNLRNINVSRYVADISADINVDASKESELEEAAKSDEDVRETKIKKKIKEDKQADEKDSRRPKKVRGRGRGSSRTGSRPPKSSAGRSRSQISSGNPVPLRRRLYNLRPQVRDYYSFGSNSSPQVNKSLDASVDVSGSIRI